jgi:HK97 family phage prohead protease
MQKDKTMAKEKRFILSDGSEQNSMGFYVNVSGIDLKRFEKNPVMLYMHDRCAVIGKWDDIKIESNQLSALPVFDSEDPKGKEVAGKVERGFLKGASVYLYPVKWIETEGKRVLEKSLLMEASIVSIPADGNAVMLCDKGGKALSDNDVKLMFNQNKSQIMNEERKDPSAETLALKLQQEAADKDRQIAQLSAELKAEKEKAITAYLDGAVKAGKISEAEKAHYIKLAAADFDSVKKILDSKAEQASTSLAAAVQNSKTAAFAGREDWDYLRWMKEDQAGLVKLKAENPSAFAELQKTIKK